MKYLVLYELEVKPTNVTIEISCQTKDQQNELFLERLANSNLKNVRREEKDV